MTPNFYAGLELDRMAERRSDTAWLETLLRNPASRLVPVWRSRNLVVEQPEPRALLVETTRIASLDGTMFLGIARETAYFAADYSHLEEPELPSLFGTEGRFVDLRSVGAVMDRQQGALLAYARGLAHWHSRHRFCAGCGAPTVITQGGHVRHCTAPGCGADHFPRTDPAVIMLVTHGDKAFLARNKRFPFPMYSTLAGFVEPGESLEEAVAREVYEESALRVTDVRYQSSQPWPFPCSIMLGFRARALNTDFRIDNEELIDAGWFDRAHLRATHDPEVFRIPRADSIARRLIEDWIAEAP